MGVQSCYSQKYLLSVPQCAAQISGADWRTAPPMNKVVGLVRQGTEIDAIGVHGNEGHSWTPAVQVGPEDWSGPARVALSPLKYRKVAGEEDEVVQGATWRAKRETKKQTH